MRRWYIIDDCICSKGLVSEEALDCSTQEEAFAIATRRWNILSDRDKKRRDSYYIGYADTNESGRVDYDSMTNIMEVYYDECQ